MTDCVKACLIINEECLDIKGLILEEGKGIIALDDTTVHINAGEVLTQKESALPRVQKWVTSLLTMTER